VRTALEALPVKLNIFRTIAHAQTCILPMLQLANAILFQQALGARERELVTLLIASQEQGAYEWRLHLDIAGGVGVQKAQIAAIERNDIASPEFSEREQALLAFASQVSQNVRVEQKLFDAMHAHFSDREIVETIIVIGFYHTMTRITEAIEVEIDDARVDLNTASTFGSKISAAGAP
jgi:alkylhydroperoxidase family enzyme